MKKSTSKIKKVKVSRGIPLAVVGALEGVCLLERIDKKTTSTLSFQWSPNGVDFSPIHRKITIKSIHGKSERIKSCDRFSLSVTPNGYVMTFVRAGTKTKPSQVIVARSRDLFEWKILSELAVDEFHHTTIVYDKPRDSFELYRDGLFIKSQSSATLSFWRERPTLLFSSRNDMFDRGRLSIIGSLVTEDGPLLLYDATVENKGKILLQAGAVIFEKNNPKKVVWRSSLPVWQGILESKKKSTITSPIGFVSVGKKIIIYWSTNDGDLVIAIVPSLFKEIEDAKFRPKILDRFHGNPIIEPRSYHDDWEGEGTFNPAAVEDDEGVVHLLYRAIGRDGISRVGYAQSKDGKHFFNRSRYPVFEPSMGFGLPDPNKALGPIGYHPAVYTSGGGWGGAEDPRAVRIDDRVYMMYVAFEGWNSVRIAMTSISIDDFKANRWRWRKPVLLSPPGKVNKNWLIFPEKIHGKFAILHSIAPKIMIEYIDDLENIERYIESPRKEGPQPGRKSSWDNVLRGAGPPPIKTELGWLLLYHALEKTESHKYKLGAMILDKNDPAKVLYRSKHPILAPDMHYENNGKPGVIYASGAVVRDGDLYIYYGGADKVVCMATTPLKKFLKYLTTGDIKPYKLDKTS